MRRRWPLFLTALAVACIPDVVPTEEAPPFPVGCLDRQTNGDETDVDCGGAQCGKCFAGAHCSTASDCEIGLCTAGACESLATGVWELRSPVTQLTPSARSGHNMVFYVDPQPTTGMKATLLFGGPIDGRMWSWDGEQWQVLTLAANSPVARTGAVMVFVPPTSVVMFGGLSTVGQSQTYHFNGSAWKDLMKDQNPGARAYASAAWDETIQRVRFLGGYEKPTETAAPTLIEGEWYWDDGDQQWSVYTLPVMPARASAAMVYAEFTSVLFGGTQADRVGMNDLWTFGNGGWKEVTPLTNPSKRFGSAMAFSTKRKRVVLFGGADGDTRFDDTWELDVKTLSWSKITTPVAPSPREYTAMAYDQVRSRMVLFGGNDGASDLGDLWEYHLVGNRCETANDCDTAACVDGVCCATSTCGVCQACNVPGAVGTCSDVPVGRTDPDSCAGYCKSAAVCGQ